MLQTTRLSKFLSALLVLGFAVQWFIPDTRSYLALVPGKTLPMVWNLLSAGFLITNPIELVVNVGMLLALARLVEPVHGSKEFLKFVFVVELLVSSTVFAAVYILYALAPVSRGMLLYTQFCGFHGVTAGLLVAVKQVMSQHEVKLLGPIKFSAKFLPSVALILFSGLTHMLNRLDLLAFYLPGTYLAWVYLRFFQLQPDSGGVYGDASEDFKFSSFFPDFLATPIDLVAGALGALTRLRHVHGTEGRGGHHHHHHLAGMPSALGTDSADASRRRERGAKALEERLKGSHSSANDVEGGKGTSHGVVVAAEATSS